MIVFTALDGTTKIERQSTPVAGVTKYLCFSAEQQQQQRRLPQPWESIKPKQIFRDPIRNARMVKIFPWLHLPQNDWKELLWIEPNINLSSLPKAIPKDADIAMFTDSKRSCVYDQAKECIRKKKDSKSAINTQIEQYRQLGFPRDFGMFDTRIVYRKNTLRAKTICGLWEAETTQHSRCDQLSLPFMLWKMGSVNIHNDNKIVHSLGDDCKKMCVVR